VHTLTVLILNEFINQSFDPYMTFAHVISQKMSNGNGLNIACEVDRDVVFGQVTVTVGIHVTDE